MQEHSSRDGLTIETSAGFAPWLASTGVSLAFTTYDAGQLLFVGLNDDGTLMLCNRDIGRCMGLAVAGRSLFVASFTQILRLEGGCLDNSQSPGDSFDAVYVPQTAHFTGFVNIHDIALDAERRLLFANSKFNCVAAASESHSFVPVWQPSFISELVSEDRCHLNGIALDDGRLRYASAFSMSDSLEHWRGQWMDGGVVVDCVSNEVAACGLSLPHSPRVYAEKLWVLNSGAGTFGYVDLSTATFCPVTFCPGFVRGLTFVGDFAIVGVSKPRANPSRPMYKLDAELQRMAVTPQCGLCIVDLRTGEISDWLWVDGFNQVYDVAVLEHRRAMVVGFQAHDISQAISIGNASDATRIS